VVKSFRVYRAYDNYDDFQHVFQLPIFTKFHFTILKDYLMMKLTLGYGSIVVVQVGAVKIYAW
jgi:hypothetical protein